MGRRQFGDFIDNYLPQSEGTFLCVESGTRLGTHRGMARYTPGQRARIGGRSGRMYVAAKDVQTNSILLCQGPAHPALRCAELRAAPPHWVAGEPPAVLREGGVLRCDASVRYQQSFTKCTVSTADAEGGLRVVFDEAVRHAAEQQALVLYDGEVCLGAASILSRTSLFERQPI